MKINLKSQCKVANLEKILTNKGYAFFTKGVYNLNIIGVRANRNNIVTNKFDDCLIVDYETETGHKRFIYSITTEPGLKYMLNPINAKGAAILVPGQYRGVYKLDKHNNKYKALCQRNGPVKVYRDNNRDEVYDLNPLKTEEGYFGINIHRSAQNYVTNKINSYSAGCQVFSDPKEFISFIRICERASAIWGNKFTYTLIDEKDLYE